MFVSELGRVQGQKRPGEQHQRGMAEEITGTSDRADQRTTLSHAVRQRSYIRITDAQRTAGFNRWLHEKLVMHNFKSTIFIVTMFDTYKCFYYILSRF